LVSIVIYSSLVCQAFILTWLIRAHIMMIKPLSVPLVF